MLILSLQQMQDLWLLFACIITSNCESLEEIKIRELLSQGLWYCCCSFPFFTSNCARAWYDAINLLWWVIIRCSTSSWIWGPGASISHLHFLQIYLLIFYFHSGSEREIFNGDCIFRNLGNLEKTTMHIFSLRHSHSFLLQWM